MVVTLTMPLLPEVYNRLIGVFFSASAEKLEKGREGVGGGLSQLYSCEQEWQPVVSVIL